MEERDEPHVFHAPRTLKKISPVKSSVQHVAPVTSAGGVSVGQKIEHERFGRGEIVRLEGDADNCKATVQFENAGTKQLLLKYARFKVVE